MRSFQFKFITAVTIFTVLLLLAVLRQYGGNNVESKELYSSDMEMKIRDIVKELVKDKLQHLPRLKQKNQNSLQAHIDNILNEIPRRTGIELLPMCKDAKQNYVYIKNHKCASDTLSVVFRRFGINRNSSLVQPVANKCNIGWPMPLHPGYYRASKSGKYNILTEHTVYDEGYMKTLMEPDAVYFTSIREPFSHLKSSFNFFNVPKLGHIDVKPGQDALMIFLNDMEKIDKQYQDPKTWPSRPCVPPYLSVVRNMMAFDLGLLVGFNDKSDMQEDIMYIKKWLEHIDKKFDIVSCFDFDL